VEITVNISPVVLCGGSGTRLWPLSRAGFPKQFLSLLGDHSLFQQAVTRLNALSSPSIQVGKTLVVTNEEHRFLVLDQLKDFKGLSAEILLESEAKNTAPALTLAALQAMQANQDPILVVTPADQVIQDRDAYASALNQAIAVAVSGHIVILGVKPTRLETGFGYIKCQGVSGEFAEYNVERFAEKPSSTLAESYLRSGDYFWNSGMFVVRASRWLEAIKFFRSDISRATEEAFANKTQDHQFIRPAPEKFSAIPSESIDYAVMEQCPGSPYSLKMIPLNAGWSDLGAWDAVWDLAHKDGAGNVAQGDTLIKDAHNNLVHASHRLVSLVGVDDLVVVETPDALLVTHRARGQEVKQIVAELGRNQREEVMTHRKVRRPWGWYDTIDVGDHFKVKRIQVNPGASLSLQAHSKRAEHWVVVRGVANVMCAEDSLVLHENESTYIPVGEKHRLSNPGKDPLEIIEVQTGAYLGEDDIVRFEDHYGRLGVRCNE
jgi:mannose-1-phosphate guanylyltransferase / mannose-6-phosphate isomerase